MSSYGLGVLGMLLVMSAGVALWELTAERWWLYILALGLLFAGRVLLLLADEK